MISNTPIDSKGTRINIDEATEILTDLVALRSVNPMGHSYTLATPVEREVIERVEAIFRPYGVEMQRQTCGPIHENLLVMIPGRSAGPAALFESHVDTVPADDWADRAFNPRLQNGILYGRGACDDKGPLTAMILAALDILRGDTLPPFPIILMAAGDEEYGQSGIKHFAARQLPLKRAIVGEATDLVPVIQHNGTVRWDITVHGRSAHTSRPELGCNAILGAVEVVEHLQEYQKLLRATWSNPRTHVDCLDDPRRPHTQCSTGRMYDGGRLPHPSNHESSPSARGSYPHAGSPKIPDITQRNSTRDATAFNFSG